MKLKPFDQKSRGQWLESGYKYVKLTRSNDVGLTSLNAESFTLLEPYLNIEEALDSNSVVDINSPQIQEIIDNGTGRFYQ